MKQINNILLLILVQLILQTLFAAPQGIPFAPPVFNYNTSNYRAGNQNWSISQDKNEIMYFANNRGLLSFDGVNWNLHSLPNNRGVKSIYIDSDNKDSEKIYVGSFEEFGYFARDSANRLVYHSLKPFIANYTFKNDEIWTILEHNDKIHFQSFSSYFIYNNNTVTAHKTNPSPLFFFTLNNNLYGQLIKDGLFQFNGVDFKRITTREQVLDDELRNAIANRVVSVSDSLFVIGTLNDGVYGINDKGKLKWHINRKNGLNNNTVLGLFKDFEGNLWVALDNGISNIQLNYDISIFEPTDLQIGMVEDMLIADNKTYVAINQGVYAYNPTIESFTQLPEFNIQTWYIKQVGDQIIAGHNKGASFIDSHKHTLIKESSIGGTDIKEVTINGKEALIESTYSFLSVFLKDNSNKWQFSHNITDGFQDLATTIEVDHTGNIWLNHMYKGIYRLRLDKEIKRVVEKEYFDRLDSLSQPTPLNLMKLRGRIVMTDGNLFYTYDDISHKITPYNKLNNQRPLLKGTYRIVTVENDLFWFIKNNEYILVKHKLGNYTINDRVPFSIFENPPNQGRSTIYIYIDSNGTSYFCLNGGIAKYNYVEKNEETIKNIILQSIWSHDRNLNTDKYLPLDKFNVLDFKENTVRASFIYPDYSKKEIKVECFLENYDTRWIPTNKQLTITYSNLPPNEYILKARVINDLGEVLSELSFPFEIKDPWYQSDWAYIIYIDTVLKKCVK